MFLPVLPSVPGSEALETFMSDDYLSRGHPYPRFSVPVSSFQDFLEGISARNVLAMFIWEYKHVGGLTSG